MIRTFVAVELDASLRQALAQAQANLRSQLQRTLGPDVRIQWVKPESVHLTLKFLGDIPEDRVPDIQAALARAAGGHGRFTVTVEGLGVFPDFRAPRVVWAGMTAQADAVQRLVADPWLGRWMRSLHRFASAAMVLFAVIHAFRMFAQARSWGPRALAWVSGVGLLLLVYVSGWTGFVIVWDTFGARLAIAGAVLFDALPILSEPLQRIFSGERPIPGAFFFINLFLHVAIPLIVAAGLWIHVSRVARPKLLPPRVLGVVVAGGLTLLAIVLPAPLPPEANPFELASHVPGDLVYGFWLPWAERTPAWAGWTAATGSFVVALLIPRLMRRARVGEWAAAAEDEGP